MNHFILKPIRYFTLIFLIVITSCRITNRMNNLNPKSEGVFENRKLSFSNNELSEIEVVFVEPNYEIAVVGQFEKLELGIKLPAKINELVDGFLNNFNATYLNPYDPDQINFEAIFKNERDSFKTFGFFYKEYERDMKTNNSWKDIYTDYNWRIRFAPPVIGSWTCDIQITFPNILPDTLIKKNIQFTCTEKGKKGFITVANDKRHFKFEGDDETFFPIGQNIPWTDEPFFKGYWLNPNTYGYSFPNKNIKDKLYVSGFIDINNFIENAANNKGNLIRIVSWQSSYLYEWEERGVYGSNRSANDQNFIRQKRAWELDRLFETAEIHDLKLLFCMEFQGQYNYFWNGGDANSFYFNPYNKVENNRIITSKQPQDFFENRILIDAYKKKLRYFIARWGYSPSLGIFQLLSEFDGWSTDSTKESKRIDVMIKANIKLQKNINNWHNEIGNYLHTESYRPMIVTSGFMGNTKPTDLPNRRNFYNSSGIDMVVWNMYGNDRSINYEMYIEAKHFLAAFEKPFLYTETGIITNPVSNIDPGDLEGCDDVMFHNFTWAGSAMGCAGTNLEWWQQFDNKRRENYKALDVFYKSIDFSTVEYTDNDRWNDGGTALYICDRHPRRTLKKKSFIEVYYVRTKNIKQKNQVGQVFGWAHNLTNYWANLSSYMNCADRNNKYPQANNCDDDKYNEPIILNKIDHKIKIKGLKTNSNYEIQWYSTRGEGGIIFSSVIKTNGFGTISLVWPGTDFDYAFKMIEKPEAK